MCGISPERQRLAEAIDRLSVLDTQLNRIAEARSRLDLRGKERAYDAALRALADAKQRAPEMAIARAMVEPFDPTATTAHAEGLVDDARRDLNETAEADGVLAEEIRAVEQRRELAFHGRNDALTGVLRTAPEVRALAESFVATREKLWSFSWIFSVIGRRALPDQVWDGVCGAETSARRRLGKRRLPRSRRTPTQSCRHLARKIDVKHHWTRMRFETTVRTEIACQRPSEAC
jgi:hypothetical protein